MSAKQTAADDLRKDASTEEFEKELNVSVFKIDTAAATLRFIANGVDGILMDHGERDKIVCALWGVIEHLEAASKTLTPYV